MSEHRKGKNHFDNSQFVKDIEKVLKELDNEVVNDEFNFSFPDLLGSDKHTAKAVKQQRHIADDEDEDHDDEDDDDEDDKDKDKDSDDVDQEILHFLENRSVGGEVTSQGAIGDAGAATIDMASEETTPCKVETQMTATDACVAEVAATSGEAVSQTAVTDTYVAKPSKRRTAKSQPKSL